MEELDGWIRIKISGVCSTCVVMLCYCIMLGYAAMLERIPGAVFLRVYAIFES